MQLRLLKKVAAEFLGTAFLLAAIVGSGIMAQRLSGGNLGVALLANSLATGGMLLCIIVIFGPISGGHFNPVVSICDAIEGGLSWPLAVAYVFVQISGALAGVFAAHAMFGLPLVFVSHHVRSGAAQWFAEFVATFGLLAVIWGTIRYRSSLVPFTVAAYIVAAYWFTASTSFANPAVTIARSLTDTFSGIRPLDVAPFTVAQILGALCATALFAWLVPNMRTQAMRMLLPRADP